MMVEASDMSSGSPVLVVESEITKYSTSTKYGPSSYGTLFIDCTCMDIGIEVLLELEAWEENIDLFGGIFII